MLNSGVITSFELDDNLQYHLLISKVCLRSFRASNPLQSVSDLPFSKFRHKVHYLDRSGGCLFYAFHYNWPPSSHTYAQYM